jgi:hypothetical protein
MKRILLICCLALSACVTGEKFSRLRPGMTKPQVESLLGSPKGYAQTGADEVLQYPGGLISGWSYDTADFVVVLHNGLVTSYGASNVQKGQHPTVVVIPAPITGN